MKEEEVKEGEGIEEEEKKDGDFAQPLPRTDIIEEMKLESND